MKQNRFRNFLHSWQYRTPLNLARAITCLYSSSVQFLGKTRSLCALPGMVFSRKVWKKREVGDDFGIFFEKKGLGEVRFEWSRKARLREGKRMNKAMKGERNRFYTLLLRICLSLEYKENIFI